MESGQFSAAIALVGYTSPRPPISFCADVFPVFRELGGFEESC